MLDKESLKKWFGPGIIDYLVNGGIALGLVGGGIIGIIIHEHHSVFVSIVSGIASAIGLGLPLVLLGRHLNEKWFPDKKQKEMSG